MYWYRTVADVLNFTILFVFYCMILVMVQFSDNIYLREIETIKESAFKFGQEELEEIEYTHQKLLVSARKNHNIKVYVLSVFGLINFVFLIIEVYTASHSNAYVGDMWF